MASSGQSVDDKIADLVNSAMHDVVDGKLR